MYSVLTFPLRNDLPQYSFPITLTNVNYVFQVIYNVRMDRWIMNINDVAGNQILSGIPVLIQRGMTGQYATLAVPAGIFLATDNTGKQQQPTQYSFGVTHSCYYIDPGA